MAHSQHSAVEECGKLNFGVPLFQALAQIKTEVEAELDRVTDTAQLPQPRNQFGTAAVRALELAALVLRAAERVQFALPGTFSFEQAAAYQKIAEIFQALPREMGRR